MKACDIEEVNGLLRKLKAVDRSLSNTHDEARRYTAAIVNNRGPYTIEGLDTNMDLRIAVRLELKKNRQRILEELISLGVKP